MASLNALAVGQAHSREDADLERLSTAERRPTMGMMPASHRASRVVLPTPGTPDTKEVIYL